MTGGCWVGTIDGNATAGTTKNGFTITASGTDENGDPVTGYILGKGDFSILDAGETPQPDAPFAYVRLLDGESEDPKTGDLYPVSGDYYIWQNGQRNQLGGDVTKEELATKADLSIVENLSIDVAELDAAISGKAEVSALSSYWGKEDHELSAAEKIVVGSPQDFTFGTGARLSYPDDDGYQLLLARNKYQQGQLVNCQLRIDANGRINYGMVNTYGVWIDKGTFFLPELQNDLDATLATTKDLSGKADLSALSGYLPFDKYNTDLSAGYATFLYAVRLAKKWDRPDLSSLPTLEVDAGVYGDNKRVVRVWDSEKNNLIVGFNENGLPQIMYGYDDFDVNPNPRTLTYPAEGGTIATVNDITATYEARISALEARLAALEGS